MINIYVGGHGETLPSQEITGWNTIGRRKAKFVNSRMPIDSMYCTWGTTPRQGFGGDRTVKVTTRWASNVIPQVLFKVIGFSSDLHQANTDYSDDNNMDKRDHQKPFHQLKRTSHLQTGHIKHLKHIDGYYYNFTEMTLTIIKWNVQGMRSPNKDQKS